MSYLESVNHLKCDFRKMPIKKLFNNEINDHNAQQR